MAGRLVKLEDLFHGDGAALQALQAVLNVCGGVHKAAQRDFAVFGLAETKGRIHPVGNVETRDQIEKLGIERTLKAAERASIIILLTEDVYPMSRSFSFGLKLQF